MCHACTTHSARGIGRPLPERNPMTDRNPYHPEGAWPTPEQRDRFWEGAYLDANTRYHQTRVMARLWKETTRRTVQARDAARLEAITLRTALESDIRSREEAETKLALVSATCEEVEDQFTETRKRAEQAEGTLSLVQQQRDQATALAKKAERERDEAIAFMTEAQEEATRQAVRADTAEPRPLTPDAITDEMVERARAEAGAWDHQMSGVGMRYILTAALTEPPARPEGAEELRPILVEFAKENAARAGAGDDLDLADFLAERGVRAARRDEEKR